MFFHDIKLRIRQSRRLAKNFRWYGDFADIMKDRIESIKQISGVDIVGALEQEIQINVDLNKMNAAQISFNDIERAIGYENISASGGTINIDGVRRTLNIKKEFIKILKNL